MIQFYADGRCRVHNGYHRLELLTIKIIKQSIGNKYSVASLIFYYYLILKKNILKSFISKYKCVDSSRVFYFFVILKKKKKLSKTIIIQIKRNLHNY